MRTSQSIQIVGTRIHIIFAPLPQHSYFFPFSLNERQTVGQFSYLDTSFTIHLSVYFHSLLVQRRVVNALFCLEGGWKIIRSRETRTRIISRMEWIIAGLFCSSSFLFFFLFFFRSPLVLLLSIIIWMTDNPVAVQPTLMHSRYAIFSLN